jgi:hypothetical protein
VTTMREAEWGGLTAAFATFRAHPFPRNGRDPRVQDAFVNLVDYDGYIAGIISRMLQDRRAPVYPLKLEPGLRAELVGLAGRHGPEGSAATAMLRYLDELEEVVKRAVTIASDMR